MKENTKTILTDLVGRKFQKGSIVVCQDAYYKFTLGLVTKVTPKMCTVVRLLLTPPYESEDELKMYLLSFRGALRSRLDYPQKAYPQRIHKNKCHVLYTHFEKL